MRVATLLLLLLTASCLSRTEWPNGQQSARQADSDAATNGDSSNGDPGDPPPCTGALGSVCSTGATGSAGTPLYAGAIGDYHCMTTPSGCADVDGSDTLDYSRRELVPSVAFTPVCFGGFDDFVVKDWTAGTTFEVRSALSADDGSANTAILAGEPNDSTPKTSTAVHPAAEYCAWLDYGGYDDWYLPSTVELARLYCLSNGGGGHQASNPVVDADCASVGGGGPQDVLTGFATSSLYATSTEANSSTPWQIDMWNGYVDDYDGKSMAFRVRCMRRYP